jgi:hypothetical protein
MAAPPFLIFLHHEGSEPDESFCREKIQQWIIRNYGPASFTLEKSAPSLMGGERENGFQDSYTRSVSLVIQLADGRLWKVSMETEGSSSESFDNSWRHSFYALQFTFTDLPQWAEMANFLDRAVPLMKELHFYHHTFEFYSDQLVYHALSIQDTFGVDALHRYVYEALKRKTQQDAQQNGSIEIQQNPKINLNALLSSIEDKPNVHSISIPNNGLSAWPEALFQFEALHYLYLYNNPLEEIDERINQLKELKLVNVHSCPFGKDPLKLAAFKALLPEACEIQYF